MVGDMADKLLKYYKILEISLDASLAEIKSHFRDLISIWHPDRFADHPRRQKLAEEKTKQIIEAYQEIESYFKAYGKPQFSSRNNDQSKERNDFSTEGSPPSGKDRNNGAHAQAGASRTERETAQGDKWKAWAESAKNEDYGKKREGDTDKTATEMHNENQNMHFNGKCNPPSILYRSIVVIILLVIFYIIGTMIEKKELEQNTDISMVKEATDATANTSEYNTSQEKEHTASLVSYQKFEKVDIPKEIYQVLEKEEQNLPGIFGKVESDFAAEKCYLNNDKEPEIIIWRVSASNMPINIYAKTVDGYKIILETDVSANGLSTKGSYTYNYKDIVLYMGSGAYVTGIHTFKYDGSKYREVDCVLERFIDEKTGSILKKPVYEKCEVQSERMTNQ